MKARPWRDLFARVEAVAEVAPADEQAIAQYRADGEEPIPGFERGVSLEFIEDDRTP